MKARPQGWRSTATLFFALVLCALRVPIAGAMGNPNERYNFDIETGIAAWRLNDFGTQSGMQLLFNFEAMKGVKVAAVHGEFKPFDALNRMIAGTDIRYEFVNRRTVTLTRAAASMRPSTALAEKADASLAGAADRRSAGIGLEEVTISGTPPSALSAIGSPLLSVSRTDIDASGFVTAQGVVRTLPQVFGGGPTEDTILGYEAHTNVSYGSGINLRGLDAGSTLVLLNGRRLPGSGTDGLFVDISNLPLGAVQRIDILPDSSSTVFGSDAVGGVANFVMRDTFDGRQTEAYFGNTTRGDRLDESYISQLVGGHTDSGHGLLALEFYSRGDLPAADREMARSNLLEYGGSDFDIPQSNPGNITIGTTTWAIPHGQDGSNLQPGDFVKNVPNLQDRFLGSDVLPQQQRWTGFGTWRQELPHDVSLFGDLLVGQRDMRGTSGGATYTFVVPVTNAYYASPLTLPARVPLPMRYNFYADLGSTISDARIKSTDVIGGMEKRFGHDWQLTATVGYAEERIGSLVTNLVNGAALTAALADPNRDTAFNPFGDGSYTNRATLDSMRGYIRTTYDSSVSSLSILARGPVLTLPGGNVQLTFGGDTREQRFHSTFESDTSLIPTATHTDRDRNIHSGFAELTVPIVGAANRLPGVESLAISLAERYERYNDFGSERTPRLGLAWAPLRGLTLRGSYSTSFRPPGLLDLDESNNAWAIQPLRDPQTGGVSNVLVWVGKNRDLRAENARSWTAGLEFAPEQHPQFAVAATYFDTDFTDRLSTPTLTADLLSNPTLSPLITRDPSAAYRAEVCSRAPQAAGAGGTDCLTSPIAAIADLRRRNDAIVRTRGIDTLARYEQASALGRFSFSLNGTYILDYDEAKAANLPLVDRVNTQSYPIDLKIRGSARWQWGPFDVSAYANFLNRYKDTASIPQRYVSSSTTFDLHAAYTLGPAGAGWFGDTTFALGVENLFDRDPPFLNNAAAGIGYDQENGDLTGRMVSFTVRKKW